MRGSQHAKEAIRLCNGLEAHDESVSCQSGLRKDSASFLAASLVHTSIWRRLVQLFRPSMSLCSLGPKRCVQLHPYSPGATHASPCESPIGFHIQPIETA